MKITFNCETCGKPKSRKYAANKIPGHFFCSVACQNEWQKTREDIVIKNKDPRFREKVSKGLKARKVKLGDCYHSAETKKKIGKTTIQHWKDYSEEKRNKMLNTLRNNALNKRTFGPYDYEWQKLSSIFRKGKVCFRCGNNENTCVHHVIPIKAGGTRDKLNLVVLCPSCHRIVENYSNKVNSIIGDWETTRLLVRERLGCSI